MFGIGTNELVIILVFAFLLFGPDKMPGMGRTIGRALRQFREAQEGFSQVVQSEVMDPLSDAMADPESAKKKRAAAKKGAEEDADIDDEPPVAQHEETFAQRRERLKKEKEAREAAEAAKQAEAEGEEDAAPAAPADPDVDTDDDADLDADADAAPAAQPAPEPAKPDTSAAALYSLTPRKEDGDAR